MLAGWLFVLFASIAYGCVPGAGAHQQLLLSYAPVDDHCNPAHSQEELSGKEACTIACGVQTGTALNEKSFEFDLPSINPLALYPSAYFLKPQPAVAYFYLSSRSTPLLYDDAISLRFARLTL